MSKLKNYVKKSEKNGWYSYRRRIPLKLKDSFLNSDGKPRGNEWKQALKTKSISVALRRAVEINDRFEKTKAFAKANLKDKDTPKGLLSKQEQVMRSIEIFRREGIHPDQAPSVLAPKKEQMAWLKKRDKALWEISELHDELGVEEVWSDGDEPPYFYWSMSMFRKRRTTNGKQASEGGGYYHKVAAS